MNRIPSSLFELFGTLVPAILLFTASDYVLGTSIIAGASSGMGAFTAMLTVAFVLGQAIAVFADWIFRGVLIGLVLGYPSASLFHRPARRWYTQVLAEYFAPFPDDIAARLQARFEDDGVSRRDAQFLHAFGKVTANEAHTERFARLQAMYLFFQNVSLASLSLALFGLLSLFGRTQGRGGAIGFIAAVAGVIFFLRFLKCFRQYTVEMYLLYDALAEAAHPKSATQHPRSLSVVGKDR